MVVLSGEIVNSKERGRRGENEFDVAVIAIPTVEFGILAKRRRPLASFQTIYFYDILYGVLPITNSSP